MIRSSLVARRSAAPVALLSVVAGLSALALVGVAHARRQVCERYRAVPILTTLRGNAEIILPTAAHTLGTRVVSNSDGAVAGSRIVGEGISETTEAFLWLPRDLYGLSAGLHSLHPEGAEASVAFGINDVGSVVGAVLFYPGANSVLTVGAPCLWWRGATCSTGYEFVDLSEFLPAQPESEEEGVPEEAPDPRTGIAFALSDGCSPRIFGTFGYCENADRGSLGFLLAWPSEVTGILPVDWELPTVGRPYAASSDGELVVGLQHRPPGTLCSIDIGLPNCPDEEPLQDAYAWSVDPPSATGGALPFPHFVDGEDTDYCATVAHALAVDEDRAIAVGVGQQEHATTDCARNAFLWSLGSDDLPYLNLGEFLIASTDASGAESISIAEDGLIRVAGFRRPIPDPQEEPPPPDDPVAVIWEHEGGEDLSIGWCAIDLRDVVRSCTYEGSLELAEAVNARGMVLVVTGSTLYKLAHIADFNGDDRIDGDDLGELLGAWGLEDEEGCPWELSGDPVIDGDDLGALLGYWSEEDVLLSIDPLCCESQSAVIGNLSPHAMWVAFLVALGFESDQQFLEWADGKSSAELEAAVLYAFLMMDQEEVQ